MFGPTEGQWRVMIVFGAIGVVCTAVAVVVGIPVGLWWLASHVHFQ